MSSLPSHRPVLLVHPDRAEADFLRERLVNEGVAHPILISPSIEDARDYLLATTLAHPLDARYTPCLAFVDEKFGEAEVRALVRWINEQPALSALHLVRLTADEVASGAGDAWGADSTIGPNDRVRLLRTLIARECPGN